MALAVAEAQRVLRPGGLLLDIHPAGVPMHLEAWYQRDTPAGDFDRYDRRVRLGPFAPDPSIEDFIAASAALAAASRAGFAALETFAFDYHYFFETLDELTEYLEDNEELDLASDELLEQALQALKSATQPVRLVLAQPVIVSRLQRL